MNACESSDVIRILLVDDHGPTRREICSLINSDAGLCVVAEARTGEESIEMARAFDPDIIVMDLMLPGINGTDAARTILHYNAHPRVLIVSNYCDDGLLRAVHHSGAKGYVRKEHAFETLIPAIRAVGAGRGGRICDGA